MSPIWTENTETRAIETKTARETIKLERRGKKEFLMDLTEETRLMGLS